MNIRRNHKILKIFSVALAMFFMPSNASAEVSVQGSSTSPKVLGFIEQTLKKTSDLSQKVVAHANQAAAQIASTDVSKIVSPLHVGYVSAVSGYSAAVNSVSVMGSQSASAWNEGVNQTLSSVYGYVVGKTAGLFSLFYAKGEMAGIAKSSATSSATSMSVAASSLASSTGSAAVKSIGVVSFSNSIKNNQTSSASLPPAATKSAVASPANLNAGFLTAIADSVSNLIGRVSKLEANQKVPATINKVTNNYSNYSGSYSAPAGTISGTSFSAVADSVGRVLESFKTNTMIPAINGAISDAIANGSFSGSGTSTVSSQWTTNGSDINYGSGNVGIGSSTPAVRLGVNGSAIVTGNVTAAAFFGDGSNLTGVNAAVSTSSVRAAISSTVLGITYSSSTGIFALDPNYRIPLAASTTEWANAIATVSGLSTTVSNLSASTSALSASSSAFSAFYATPSSRITAGSGLSWTGSTLANTGVLSISGMTGAVSTSSLGLVQYSDLASYLTTTGNGSGLTSLNASSISSGVLGVARGGTGTTTAPTFGQILMGNGLGGYTLVATSSLGIAGGSTLSTSTIRQMISSTATGFSYDSLTGAFSLTSGYVIPTVASTTEWGNKVSSQWSASGSDIYYASGKVGIGTTTPASALGVEGSVNVLGDLSIAGSNSASAHLDLTDDVNGYAGIDINSYQTTGSPYSYLNLVGSRGTTASPSNLLNGDTLGELNFYGMGDGASTLLGARISSVAESGFTSVPSANLIFSTNNVERFRISSDGGVGIGTVNSNEGALKVAGSIYSTASENDNPLNGSGPGWQNNANFIGTGAWWGIRTATDHSFNIDMLGSNKLTLKQNGRLGLGNSNPSANIDIVDSGYGGSISLKNSVSTYGSSISLDAQKNLYVMNNDPSYLFLGTNGASTLFLSPGGNVGIGNYPSYLFDLGTAHIASDGSASFANGSTTISATGDVTAKAFYGDGSHLTGISVGSSSQWTTSGSDISYSIGNVGIGTTSPSAKLAVVGAGLFTGNLTTNGVLNILGAGTSTITSNVSMSGDIIPSADNTYKLGAPDRMWRDVYIGPGSLYVNGQKVLQTDPSNNVTMTADVNQNLVFKSSGTGDLELNPSGTGQLLFKGNLRLTAGKTITSSDGSVIPFTNGLSAGNISVSGNTIFANNLNGGISIAATGTGGVYFTQGNVGIGTTTPGYALAVAGDLNLTGALRANGNAGTSGQILQSTGSGMQWVATSTLGIGGASSQWTTTGSDIYYATGKVGIGTTSPWTNFSVNTSAGAMSVGNDSDNYLAYNFTSAGTAVSTSYANPGGTGDRTSLVSVTSTAGGGGPSSQLVDGLFPSSGFFLAGASASGVYIQFYFNGLYKVITEAKYYQTNGASQGTWQWQGSNDGSTWTNIGGTFAFGGVTQQTLTTLSGNTTGYKYYRMYGISGTMSNSPWSQEMEFKIGNQIPGYASQQAYSAGVMGGSIILQGSGGNVGIGTVSPTSALDINGAVSIGSYAGISAAPSNGLIVSGNVGIGTTTPASTFAVAGTGLFSGALSASTITTTNGGGLNTINGALYASSELRVGSTASGGCSSTACFGAAGAATTVTVIKGFSGQTADLTRWQNSSGVTLASVSAAGNFAIGTTTAFAKLSVQQAYGAATPLFDVASTTSAGFATSSLFQIAASGAVSFGGNAGTAGYVLLSNGAGASPTWVATSSLGISAGSGTVNSGIAGQVAFYTSNGTAVSGTSSLFISTTGNIGIGTSTPGAKLNIYQGDIAFSDGAYDATISGGTLTSGTALTAGDLTIKAGSATAGAAMKGGDLILKGGDGYSGNAEQAGNVKIYAGGNTYNGAIDNYIGLFAGASERMRISSSGNIGIGTTTPGYALTVAGDLNLTGALRANGNAGTSGQILQSTGSGMQWVATSTLGISGGGGSSQWTTTGSDIYFGTGKVAIGQSAVGSTYTLEVNGSASTTRLFLPDTASSTVGGIYFGANRFISNYGTRNTFTGSSAGNFALTGTDNTAFGVSTLNGLTSGHSNVAVGSNAGTAISSGVRNVAIGYYAIGGGASTGNDNVAVGYGVGSATGVSGAGNVGLGMYAIRTLSTGNNNVAVGYGAGEAAGTAANNVFLGKAAGSLTTGSNNIMLGYQAGANLVTGTKNIIIGYDISATSTTMTNGLNIGNLIYGIGLDGSATTLSTGNIGIGTSTPYAKLTVAGETAATYFTAASTTATSTFAGGLSVGGGALAYDWSSGLTTIANASLGAMTFDNDAGMLSWMDMPVTSGAASGTVESYTAQLDGNPLLTVYGLSNGAGGVVGTGIGIGTTTPGFKLAVSGTVGFSGLTGSSGAGSLCLSASGEVVYNSGSDSCLPSLRETKYDITDLSMSATDQISALKSVSFIYKTDLSSTTRYGFIAEDTALVDTHLATYDAEGKISGIDDRAVLSVLVKAFQEIKARIDSLLAWFSPAGDKFNVQGDVCVDEVCVTKQQFKQMLLNNSGATGGVTYTGPTVETIGGDSASGAGTDSITSTSTDAGAGTATSTDSNPTPDATGDTSSSTPDIQPVPTTDVVTQ